MTSSDLPLPIVWETTLPWFTWVRDAPVLRAGEVVARCGQAVVGFDRDRGAIRWQGALDPRGGDGEFFLAAGDLFVTDIQRKPSRFTTVVAVRGDGETVWRAELGGTVSRGGAVLVGDALLALAGPPEGPQSLWEIDAVSGRIARSTPLPAGGSMLVATDEGALLLAVPMPRPGGPGLYRIERDGAGARPIVDGDVWWVGRSRDALVTVSHRKQQEHTLALRSLADLSLHWSVPCCVGTAALDDEVVVHTVRDGAAIVPVLRDAGNGTERWRSAPLPQETAAIALAGPLVLIKHLTGLVVLRRRDGAVLGHAGMGYGYGAAVDGDRIYYGGKQLLLCARLDGVGVEAQ